MMRLPLLLWLLPLLLLVLLPMINLEGRGHPELQAAWILPRSVAAVAVACADRLPRRTAAVADALVAWNMPRRTAAVAEALADRLVRRYSLHSLPLATKLPVDELPSAHLAAMEVPSNATSGLERPLLRPVQQTRAAGRQVAVITAPQLRRQAQLTTWANRWNRMKQASLQVHRTCSCCLGESAPGLHSPSDLGRSFEYNVDYTSCAAEPPTGLTPQAQNRTLAGEHRSLLPVPWELAASDSDQNRVRGRVPEYVSHRGHGAPEPRCQPAPAQWVPDSSLDGNSFLDSYPYSSLVGPDSYRNSSLDGPENTEKSQETAAVIPNDSKER